MLFSMCCCELKNLYRIQFRKVYCFELICFLKVVPMPEIPKRVGRYGSNSYESWNEFRGRSLWLVKVELRGLHLQVVPFFHIRHTLRLFILSACTIPYDWLEVCPFLFIAFVHSNGPLQWTARHELESAAYLHPTTTSFPRVHIFILRLYSCPSTIALLVQSDIMCQRFPTHPFFLPAVLDPFQHVSIPASSVLPFSRSQVNF